MKNPLPTLRLIFNGVRLIRDPRRLNDVFNLVDALDDPTRVAAAVAFFARDPAGARALRERPRVGRIDLATLRAFPAGSLGQAFAAHMTANGLDPAALPVLPAADEVGYFKAHLYETHDIRHAVTGFGADVAGELGLQAFYLAQFPSALAALLIGGGLLNMIIYAPDERDARMRAITRGWLLGKRARPLFGAAWRELWATPLADVRARFGIDLAEVDGVVSVVRGPDASTALAA